MGQGLEGATRRHRRVRAVRGNTYNRRPVPRPAEKHTAMTDPRHDLPRPGPTDGTHLRQIKSYVLRAGRMGPGQERALEALGPRFVLPYDPTLRFNPAAAFGRDAPLILEIGFGMGDATAHIASVRPGDNFLCCEVHEPGVGALLKRIGEQQLTNIRILAHDAVEVLDHMLTEASWTACTSFFPTPGTRRSTTSAA
jgi:tRNA (guanine-N7-)-methyltransferase